MPILYPENSFLGAKVKSFPRVQYEKIKELIDALNGTVASVTQATNITTAVTANGTRGTITTVALTTAAGAVSGPFTVNNSFVKSTSMVFAQVEYAAGKTGAPFAIVEGITDGSFKLKVANGGSAVLNDIVKIHFMIRNI